MLHSKPLFDNVADAAYFVPPGDWDGIQRALKRQLNTLVIGERGMGKTTLLRQLQRALREEGERVVYVDGSSLDGPMDLAERLHVALLEPDERDSRWLSPTGAPSSQGSLTFLQALDELGNAEPAVVLVDASHSGSTIYTVFGRMRDTIWQLPHRWVVAIDETDRATVLRPPADAFFDKVVNLGAVSPKQLLELLARRAPDVQPATLELVSELADGNPRTALRALAEVEVDGRDPSVSLDANARLLERASTVGRPHELVMRELLDQGPASPSDLGLQEALGVSRGRLTSILRELLDRDLVTAEPEKSDRVGRPRTIYRAKVAAR